jgi:hypothetical protein
LGDDVLVLESQLMPVSDGESPGVGAEVFVLLQRETDDLWAAAIGVLAKERDEADCE